MANTIRRALSAYIVSGVLWGLPGVSAHAAPITDSTTFTGFSVTYDQAVWGTLKFAHEADAFTQTLPVSQFGLGRFFFDPGLKASSDGSAGPADLRITGQITLDAKQGFGLYAVNFTQSGQWITTGSGIVSVDGSFVDVSAPNAQFFYTDHRAFANPLFDAQDEKTGYYYIIGDRSSFSKFDELTIDYDIHLNADVLGGPGFARLFSDVSNPSWLGGSGPYPDSNIVGTFVSVAFERLAPVALVPEPGSCALILTGLVALWRRQHRIAYKTKGDAHLFHAHQVVNRDGRSSVVHAS